MVDRTFRFIKEKSIKSCVPVVILEEELVQGIAKSNFGRKLTDIELSRFAEGCWWSNGDTFYTLTRFIMNGIESVTKAENDN